MTSFIQAFDLLVGAASAGCLGSALAKWKDRDAARNWLLLSMALAMVVLRLHAAHEPSVSVEVNR